MKKILTLTLLACATLAVAEIQTLEELASAFPAAIEFNHSAELLSFQPVQPPDVLTATTNNIKGMPFEQCLTLDIKQPGANLYAVNMVFKEANQWKAGDAGIVAFYCRTLNTQNRFGASSLMLQYKPDYADWRGHLQTDLFITKEWKLVILPFEVEIEAADTPESVLQFFFGGVDPHTFQMASLHVFNYGATFRKSQLPRSESYYPGMEPDALWRKAAKERIEKNRKANLKLTIKDAQGNPVSDAKVHARLTRHQFGFGAAVRTPLLVSPQVPAEERREYSDILTRTCSKITPTNAMKWRLYPGFKKFMPSLIDWCEEYDMTLRGHLFIWPGFERLPDGYDLYKTDAAAFRKDLVDHIEEFANLYPDAFSEWDVMNEPYTEYDFMDLLGKDVVVEWFETARNANPGYLNYINDYGILSDNNTEHRNVYHDWIQYLIDHGAPLDGIGFQGHYRTAMPPEMILERIERFAKFGKKMQITEFDFDHTDPELQARFFEDFMILVYSHPQMSALINWIYLEDDFRPSAALYRKDFTPTAMGIVWERLLTQEWHTEKILTSGANGRIALRGFKGLYQITIGHNGQTHEYTIDLSQDGKRELKLPASNPNPGEGQQNKDPCPAEG